MKTRKISIMIFLLCLSLIPLYTDAYAVKKINKKDNTNLPPLTSELQKAIMDTTPIEPAGSDIKLIHPAARLSTARLPQGYAYDGTSFYYLSQLSTGSDNLRLTKITWQKDGTYQSSFMTLKHFGHGTNLDCVRIKGKTWLWTGCDSKGGNSTAITRFTFKSGRVLNKHGSCRYRIPTSKKGRKYASNVYPAIDPEGKRLAIRYTSGDKQYFIYYNLINGQKIKPRKIIKKVSCPKTSGPFQGFDIEGARIYTIEGTASQSEMKELSKKYYPTVIRSYDYESKKIWIKTVMGASILSHREAEGIQVQPDGSIFFNLASHFKTLYTCMNIYQLNMD